MTLILTFILALWCCSETSGAAETIGNDQLSEESTLVSVAMCRSACLDEFTTKDFRTVKNCLKNSDCLMCWESCQMLHANFAIWRPMCELKEICFPGCQKACNTLTYKKQSATLRSLVIRTTYDSQRHRVTLEWNCEGNKNYSDSMFYVVLLSGDTLENKKWHQLGQTTAHVIEVKAGLLNHDTDIRLIAVTASEIIADSTVSYFDSLITRPDSLPKEDIITEVEANENLWKPRLHSMIQNQSSVGIAAKVIWPRWKNQNKSTVRYEVSWNVIDDDMEITGHLYSINNFAVLTLWPNSLYSIQVKCYSENRKLETQSEPLVIDTRSPDPEINISSINTCAGPSYPYGTISFAVIFLFSCLTLASCLLGIFIKRCSAHEKTIPTNA